MGAIQWQSHNSSPSPHFAIPNSSAHKSEEAVQSRVKTFNLCFSQRKRGERQFRKLHNGGAAHGLLPVAADCGAEPLTTFQTLMSSVHVVLEENLDRGNQGAVFVNLVSGIKYSAKR